MSEEELTPEEVLLLAQAALAPGAPVKVRSYVKHSATGKAVVVRQAIRGATGGTGRTPILPSAQTTPVISNKALQAEAAAARAGAAVQSRALAAAQKQAAAALKLKKQQQAAQKKKQQKKTAAPKTAQQKQPKTPHLGNLGALGALHGGHGGSFRALQAVRGRRGRLFPGSQALGKAMSRSNKAKQAKSKGTSSSHSSINRLAHPNIQPRITGAEKHIANSTARLDSAHRALAAAAAYRRSHGHGLHGVGAGFHEKLAGEIIKHEAQRLSSHLHMSNLVDQDILLSQEALRFSGYPVELTGQMNDETANALADFLMKEGVDIDADYE